VDVEVVVEVMVDIEVWAKTGKTTLPIKIKPKKTTNIFFIFFIILIIQLFFNLYIILIITNFFLNI